MEASTGDLYLLAFDLGWDFARFARPLNTGDDAAITAGYAAGREHFRVPQHSPNRYVSKWLQLRLNAYKRRRMLSAEVTPDYLRRIDCPTCPITLLTLTHSTLTETDWSVDRINNDGAYAAGNLMVMSSKANKAKRSKNYKEVAELAALPSEAVTDGLATAQWARVACVMVGAANWKDWGPSLGPLLTRIPEDSRAPLFFIFQHMLLDANKNTSDRNKLVRCLNRLHPIKEKHLTLRLAVERLALRLKLASYPYDVFADQALQRLLREWFITLPATKTQGLLHICSGYGADRCETEPPSTWALSTGGRF